MLASIMRFVAVFALVFMTTYCIQQALADDTAQTTYYIGDVSIYHYQTTSPLIASSSSGEVGSDAITAKGETIQYDNVVTWSDLSEERNDYRVSWSVDDTSVATVDSAGVVTPVSDGTVILTAHVDSDTEDGAVLEAKVRIEVSGQNDSRYVTGITLVDESGQTAEPAFIIDVKANPNRTLQLYALVSVFDPATEETTVYSTRDGQISAQVPDIGDVQWTLMYTNTADYVEPTTGEFRAGGDDSENTIIAYSNGGQGNARVQGEATIRCEGGDSGGDENEGYHPQDTLTVEAVYEMYPDKVVSTNTYSISDLEAMGTDTLTYTVNLTGSRGIRKVTGYGVNFGTLLRNAGIDFTNVDHFAFKTWDNVPTTISYDYLFNTDHYYLPNADLSGQEYQGAEQVFPMIAISDTGLLSVNDASTGGAGPWYEMRDNDRFHLLSGCSLDGSSNGTVQIKWINTVVVVLQGGPPVTPDDGGGGGNNGGGSNTDGNSGTGSGTNATAITMGGDSTGSGSGTDAASGSGESDTATGTAGDSGGEGSGNGSSGSWSVYQVMSRDKTQIDDPIEEDNPLKPFTMPFALGFIFAGGTESFVWFKRQGAPLARKEE